MNQIGLNSLINNKSYKLKRQCHSALTILVHISDALTQSGGIYSPVPAVSDTDLFCLEVWGREWVKVYHSHYAKSLQCFAQRCCSIEQWTELHVILEVPKLFKRCDTSISLHFRNWALIIASIFHVENVLLPQCFTVNSVIKQDIQVNTNVKCCDEIIFSTSLFRMAYDSIDTKCALKTASFLTAADMDKKPSELWRVTTTGHTTVYRVLYKLEQEV